MKSAAIILGIMATLYLAFVVLSHVDPSHEYEMPPLRIPVSHYDSVEAEYYKIGYNPQKDSLIRSLIKKKPTHFWNVYVGNNHKTDYYMIYWYKDSLMLNVTHKHFIEFKQKDSWEFGGMYRNGTILMLESSHFVPEHNISDSTYDMLKQLCLKQKKFY